MGPIEAAAAQGPQCRHRQVRPEGLRMPVSIGLGSPVNTPAYTRDQQALWQDEC